MTYDSRETSTYQGRPIDLLEFRIGSEIFRFASSDEDYVLGSDTYEASEVSRSRVLVGPESRQDTLQVTMSAQNLLARRFLVVVPGQKLTLTIRQTHLGDPDGEAPIIYVGIVRSVGFDLLGAEANIVVSPLTQALSKTAPRFVFSSTCNHVLFDRRCKANSTSFRYSGTVLAVSGNEVTVNGLNVNGDGWATAGYVTIANTDFRTIIDQTGDVLKLMQPFPPGSPVVGSEVEVFAGCDRSIDTCDAKFANVENFGGHWFVPFRNPFTVGITQGET